ncbi:hypothetical protein HUT06_12465 [Actinomadura sp. NAK00032]|nr:hypothetical protein HUT06_12465 [Actinomadura sp. NAK00032]
MAPTRRSSSGFAFALLDAFFEGAFRVFAFLGVISLSVFLVGAFRVVTVFGRADFG